ncbi:hypothetical protein [Streptomyces sp. NBC_00425]
MHGTRKRLAELLDAPMLLARYRAAMDGQGSPCMRAVQGVS